MVSTQTVLTVTKYAFGGSAALAGLALGGLWYFQRSLLYPASVPDGSKKMVPKPIELGLPYEDVTLTCPDGIKIKAFVIPARLNPISTDELRALTPAQRKDRGEKEMQDWTKEIGDQKSIDYARSRPTVIIFHANAGNMGHRVPLARKFNVDHRCNVFMLSYRGYGLSEGHPSEHGLRTDIETSIKYVQAHPILGETKLVLYGQSLGGASCLYAASKYRELFSGIILENTFYSLESLIPFIIPQIPKILLPFLLTDSWDASKTLPLVPNHIPILFIAGLRDTLVHPSQMLKLRDLRRSSGGEERLRWREFESGHNDTCLQPGYWEEIGQWLKGEVENGERVQPIGEKVAEEKDEDLEEYSHITVEEAMERKKEL